MFINLNSAGNNWELSFPEPGTVVKNIRFDNILKQIPNLKGICTAGSFEVNTCYWFYFLQAVANLPASSSNQSLYSDTRKIVKCSFSSPGSFHSRAGVYAFDLIALGDALLFQQNHIVNTAGKAKALHLEMCNSGSINANIINDDILIKWCKAVTFTANHLEEGAQLVITDSNVTSMNNFFEKRTVPSMVINTTSSEGNTAVVKSSGDLFLFYDAQASETSSNVSTINEYDVQVGGRCSLDFSQSYRYWVTRGLIGTMLPHGIALCNDANLPVVDFNEQSYLLSSKGRVMSHLNVINSEYMNNLLDPSSYGYGPVGNCKWQAATGTYYYKYQILWDRRRLIVGQNGNFTWVTTGTTNISMTLNGNGLLLHLVGSTCGNQAMIRFYRGTSPNSFTQFVDVPISGGHYIYDNGFSICGYRWKSIGSEHLTSFNNNIIALKFNGKNIECKAPAAPLYGTWQEGDIVFNTNASTTTAHWIFLSGAWRAKP